MKKKVKALIIATSVAAIAGIGAVSFAAWSATAPSAGTPAGATGSINVEAGTIEIKSNNIVKLKEDESNKNDVCLLLPYDQELQTGKNTTMQTFTVGYVAGDDGVAANSYTYKMSLGTTNLKLYYQLGASVTVPTEDITAEDYDGDWTLFDEAVTLELAEGDVTVNIVLVSTDTDDMKTDYTITISATPV